MDGGRRGKLRRLPLQGGSTVPKLNHDFPTLKSETARTDLDNQRGYYSEVLNSQLKVVSRSGDAELHVELADDALTEGLSAPVSTDVGGNLNVQSYWETPTNIGTSKNDSVNVGRQSAVIEPKVMLPFLPRDGETPRKIEIERRKRAWDTVDIGRVVKEALLTEKLLLEEMLFVFPVSLFDNDEFDDRSPMEWLGYTYSQDFPLKGTLYFNTANQKSGYNINNRPNQGAPARVLLTNGNRSLSLLESMNWTNAIVIGWSAEKNEFLVRLLDSSTEEIWLHRINICFLSENPYNFAARVVAAYKEVSNCVETLKYHLYIDNMPISSSEIESSNDVISRIGKRMTVFTRRLQKQRKSSPQNSMWIQEVSNVLIKEVGEDWSRVMNLLLFNRLVQNRELFSNLSIPASVVPQKKNDLKWPLFDHDHSELFLKNKKSFSFTSFLTRLEVVKTYTRIRVECERIAGGASSGVKGDGAGILAMSGVPMPPSDRVTAGPQSSNTAGSNLTSVNNLFITTITKSVRLEEFEQNQTANWANAKAYLRDVWISVTKNIIKSGLKDIGKGWFNLSEVNIEVYEMSKLKRFMTMVQFIMQDSLRSLVNNSVKSFLDMLYSACSNEIIIRGTSDVEIKEGQKSRKASKIFHNGHYPTVFGISPMSNRKPLFLIDLITVDGRVEYSTELVSYETALLNCFDKALTAIEGLPQLEPLVMDQLFWASKSNLESVGISESLMDNSRKQISHLVKQSFIPVEKYRSMYESYLPVLQCTAAKYSADLEAKNLTVDEMELEIQSHQREIVAIDKSCPSHVSLGLFWVNCESIRNALLRKRKELAKVVLDILAKRTFKTAAGIAQVFQAVQLKLNERPTKIEELIELKEYMTSVNEIVKQQAVKIQALLKDHELLERYRYELPNEEFKAKWTAFGWPQKIDQLIERTEKTLENDQQTFMKNLMADQESFKDRIHHLAVVVTDFSKYADLSKLQEIVAEVHKTARELKECQNLVTLFNNREKLFAIEITNYEEVASLVRDFEPYKSLWLTTADWIKWKSSWLNDPFMNLDPEEVEKNLTAAWRTMFKAVKTFRQVGGCLAVATQIKEEMEEFKPYLPLIQALRNPGMRDRHWEQLSKELGIVLKPSNNLTLTGVLDMQLLGKLDIITKICDVAGKEYSIEAALDKMENEWKPIELEVLPYRESGTFIMKASEETLQQLDDHIVMTQSMSFSPYKKPFQDRIASWEQRLRVVQEVLDEWMNCQRSWLYLEPIFGSDDITRQLPTESKRFTTMDRTWRRVMSQARSRPAVIEFCADPRLLESFREANKLLDLVSKGLSAYLESKRAAFPRFFFLSDDELLQILSQTKDPAAVQPHLRKCFENISKLKFEGSENLVTAMTSAEGEVVSLCESFYPKGNVEDWLLMVETVMKKSVRAVIRSAIEDYPNVPRTQWVLKWPGQAVLAGSQTYWTKEVAMAIQNESKGVTEFGLKALYEQLLNQLGGLVDLVRGELSQLARLSLCALIVIDVHARDVVGKLLQEKVKSENDFEWISQLRYYWENDDLFVKIVNANFKYGYEYLGNNGRLVITPLTDRCYLTLSGAMHLNMGGAPAGPAGTGKTETVKDLAKALAKQCVVFNCSDQLDYLAMAKFFKGLASSGAWACFDEFNRIDIEVLSVIAQQISSIQKAIAAGVSRFIFEGVEIGLDPTNAIFITMNPGYAGRTELPDNLKALFRPVAMMIPDYAMIAEIMLYSFGFSGARVLSKKMVATFKLSSEQLSSQDHYDFGMRAVKTVISSAGNLKRELPNLPEDIILLRALCNCNLPKFLSEDVPLFNGIISDLFPGIEMPKVDYGELLSSIHNTCNVLGLQAVDNFVRKCIQMYETTVVRHGLMLVGPTGGGKTRCIQVLAKAMTHLKGKPSPSGSPFEKVQTVTVNPKGITMGQLYGEFDQQTHEWTDGILSSLVREGSQDTTNDKKWYIFDGPVDAVWIESMNTVLDDNKKLCLSSGEIIKLTPTQTMVFEVENLAFASPATVSRCGMVYIEPGALGLDPLVKSWLGQLHSNFAAYINQLQSLFDYYLVSSLEFVRRNMKEAVPTNDGNLTQSLMRLLDCHFAAYTPTEEGPVPAEKLADLAELLDAFFLFSLIWSVGGTTDIDGRRSFSGFVRTKLATQPLKISMPEMGLIYDYYLDQENKKWANWLTKCPEYRVDPKVPFSEIIVPTLDTIRNTHLIDMLLRNNFHALCTGPTGTGKSVTVTDKLMNGLWPNTTPIVMSFSARTGANQTQDFLDSKFDKRRKGVFGPPVGKKYIIFVDDLNMPALETYGAQPPIELLRQWMDHKGWYDRKLVGQFKEIVDITFACAMGPPGGGRNPITMRLTRHFNLLSFIEMEQESLKRIFETILSSFLGNFADNISKLVPATVSATVHVYDTIRSELLPTPTKSHYTFNLRDLSKVFQGILSVDPKSVKDHQDIIRLWTHENCRIFQDRLVNSQDRVWFLELIKETLNKYFQLSWSDVITSEPLLYGDYMTPGADPKSYSEVKDMKRLVKTCEEYLEDYNSTTTAQMKLVMFLDAIEHVSRICRIIRQPLGNALLLGVGGSGRQSLSRLATFMEEYSFFQIEISKNYGQAEWREDLKKFLFNAGIDGKQTVFLFCDTQIVQESFLEDINNILNSGDVPNIYMPDESDRIMNAIRPIMQEMGVPTSRENIFAHYLKRIRQNLHIILCMSPMGEAFRNRLRMFPSLVNCCTIDWFSEWPEEALRSVAASSVAEMLDLGTEQVVDGIVRLCVIMHESVRAKCLQFEIELNRHSYVTPKSYLELLGLYKVLMDKKKAELNALKKRTATGLEKLLTTTKEVEILQEELEAMRPMLIQTSQETEDAMKKIAIDKAKAEEFKEVVVKEELSASRKAEETKSIAADAKRDLDEALPALDSAVASLKNLTKADIIEVRTMLHPPEGVKLVLEAICIMKGIKPKKIDGDKPGKKIDDYSEPGRGLMSDPQKFLDSLMTYEKDSIPEAVITKIKPYIDSPDFTPEVISKSSKAATSMCQWVRAMEKYYHVSRAIAPKRARLEEAEQSLAATVKTLNDTKKKMKEVEMNIKEMEKRFAESLAKKEELGRKMDECTLKLSRADKLITGLGDEKLRWAATVEQLDKQVTNVVGDVLLCSGAIAYLGPFTSEYRLALWKFWASKLDEFKVPHSDVTTLMDILGDHVKVRQWEIFGLPKDSLSRDNAIIAQNSKRWPLFIDPQGQANKWIRHMEKENSLDIIKLSDKDFVRTLENCVRFGKPCLLENIQEDLDPILEPILQRQTFKQAGNVVIKVGDSILPYHDDFRFYITTKRPNPHFPPEVNAKLTVLNFTLAPVGLEDQLLAQVVASERPDLEDAKNQLVISNAKMKKELKDIEDKILYLLSSVQGSPVDDERLIDTLAASKKTSSEIQLKVASAEKTEHDIDNTRHGYAPVAIRTRILFFSITELANIDPMYQYSLGWFLNLFASAIDKSEKSDVLSDRLRNLNEFFTFSLYTNVCRSLFEKDKLLFSFLLCTRIMMDENRVDMTEWRFLLSGGTGVERKLPNPAPDWLSDRSWTEIQMLCNLPKFKGFDSDFGQYLEGFQRIFDSAEPHVEELPGKWQEHLDQFQKILVLRCLRSDKVTSAVQNFVAANLGDRFVEPQTSELSASYKESTPLSPLIFVLSSGADPSASLYKFAEEMRFSKKLSVISLGQGQGPRAETLIKEATEKGLWVLLQNCHLSPSWMPSLDRIVENITPDRVHRDFRLWLTSMATPKFPVSILQNGVKMTVEPPKGVKANLMRTFATFDDEFFASCGKQAPWKKLLFSLTFFHAVIQERRKFGPLGWNIPYEFTDSDLRICVRQLKMFLEEYEEIPFKVLQYTVGHINYGGRVTDDWDRRLIMGILDDFYSPKALEEGYRFSTSETYYQPTVEKLQDLKNFIKALPINESTEIFSMHENANITFAQKETFSMFETLLTLMPKQLTTSGGKSRDEIIADAATNILKKIPKPFNIEDVTKKYPIEYKESMSTVLVQEVVRYNRLVAVVIRTLQDLLKAIKGLVVMSESLEKMFNSIFINQVPEIWAAKAYPSLKPLSSWVVDFLSRLEFIKRWYDSGIPNVFWISGFFFPQAFLTGTLQNFARKYIVPIDSLSFEFKVLDKKEDDILSKPEDGCYIRGLYLEGARWDGGKYSLVESRPKELFTEMSIMWLVPKKNRDVPKTGIYECPVYKTLTRAGTLSTTGHSTNYVLTVELPSDQLQEHWVKRGVALLCSLNY